MSATPDFILKQKIFTQHCRNPATAPAPDNIEDRRMQIYRDLLYNNIESFMANNFPVIRQIYADDLWHELIRDYFSKHRASTPYFPKLPGEFVRFLESERDKETDPPYLLELAHYEWVESIIATDTRELPEPSRYRPIPDMQGLLDGVIVLNPVMMILAYQYPVHQISPEFLPEETSSASHYLTVYRDREDKVGFMSLNHVTARLLELLSNENQETTLTLLKSIAEEMQHPNPDIVIKGGVDVLRQMYDRDIVLGLHPKSVI